jgi:hypothetical protein
MLNNQRPDAAQFIWRKPFIVGKCDWLEPEFAGKPFAFYMNMHAFVAIKTYRRKNGMSLKFLLWSA